MFVPKTNGYILPTSALAGVGVGSGSGAVNNSYQINVTVGPMADPAEAGRQIVSAIKTFERGSSANWRGG